MKFTIIAAALAVAAPLAFAGAAHADNAQSTTLEISYDRAQITGPSLGFDTVELRGGYQFTKNWGVEMEGGFGVDSAKISTVTVKQQWEIGMYVDGYLPVGGDTDLTARVGYSRTQFGVSGPGASGNAQNYGAAAGLGVRGFFGGGNNGWRADFTHGFYNGGTALNAFSVTYVHRFK